VILVQPMPTVPDAGGGLSGFLASLLCRRFSINVFQHGIGKATAQPVPPQTL
jgi:hypothetical protein